MELHRGVQDVRREVREHNRMRVGPVRGSSLLCDELGKSGNRPVSYAWTFGCDRQTKTCLMTGIATDGMAILATGSYAAGESGRWAREGAWQQKDRRAGNLELSGGHRRRNRDDRAWKVSAGGGPWVVVSEISGDAAAVGVAKEPLRTGEAVATESIKNIPLRWYEEGVQRRRRGMLIEELFDPNVSFRSARRWAKEKESRRPGSSSRANLAGAARPAGRRCEDRAGKGRPGVRGTEGERASPRGVSGHPAHGQSGGDARTHRGTRGERQDHRVPQRPRGPAGPDERGWGRGRRRSRSIKSPMVRYIEEFLNQQKFDLAEEIFARDYAVKRTAHDAGSQCAGDEGEDTTRPCGPVFPMSISRSWT
ncbi:MAG: hypothetical protein MZU79_02980 [Anaerotruncus sp.]|nr:hypothetical protein [Anaerotruncus sp.]